MQFLIGVGPGDVFEERQEFLVAVTRFADPGDLAGGNVQRGEQRGGAVADVVVGVALGDPDLHMAGAVRSNAWIWDFSSTQSTIAFSGGSR
jgi:hypothetical protein